MHRVIGCLATLATTLLLVVSPTLGSVSIYVEPEQLAARAPVVVEGEVVRVASGLDPDRGRIATYVTVSVEEVLRGPVGLDVVTLREPGGRFGDVGVAVDAVPVYEPGERVIVFLEPRGDGSLRTAGMFYGKYRVTSGPRGYREAIRNLGGQGLVLGRRADREERMRIADLRAVVATHPGPEAGRAWTSTPPEFARVHWDETPSTSPSAFEGRQGETTTVDDVAGFTTGDEPAGERFVPLSSSTPVRWYQADQDQPILIDLQRSGNPLGDGAASRDEIARALQAWGDVPESRLDLRFDDDDFTYGSTDSPADRFPSSNVILFDDPFDDIADPSGCSGVLAIGGYWYSGSSGPTINNQTFRQASRLYVIFNNDFECFLGNADNLAEVATHELGHGLGFGHSSMSDAVMRSTAYGSRGPRLGDDDRDAAHCHYPHELDVTSPDGGESWTGGTVHTISWTRTTEIGPDEGVVTLEYTADGGQTWNLIAQDQPNDGSHDWTVPVVTSAAMRVRVTRPNRAGGQPTGYPTACSGSESASTFLVTAPVVLPGDLGTTLRAERYAGTLVLLNWQASCSADATDHAIYTGSLSTLRQGVWDPQPLTCAAGSDLTQMVDPGVGDRYYLVTPTTATTEGALGRDGSGWLRPASPAACLTRDVQPTCD